MTVSIHPRQPPVAQPRPADRSDRDRAEGTTGAVKKAALVMRTIACSLRPPTLSTIARSAQLPKSTVHRLLRTLEVEEMVLRVGDGYKVRQNALECRQDQYARDMSLPAMLRAYEVTHLVVQLMVLENDIVRCIEQFGANHCVSTLTAGRGATWSAFSVAAGKALLACRRNQTLPRQAKIAFDQGQTHSGLATAAVVVLREEHVSAAISVTGPLRRLTQPDVLSHLGCLPVLFDGRKAAYRDHSTEAGCGRPRTPHFAGSVNL
ncbi:helix-turn-helix domain-containing protein [Kibdelosporangium aridum]|uniref:helix-turn-helix domain-containing protein n=1 Tax=Kibdelosporangium aridum TaxID=2030 RepID=UPI0035E9D6D2